MGYPNLKHYAKFLLNHLDNLVVEQINAAKEIQLPLLDFFSTVTERDFFNYVRQELEGFLKSFVEERAIDAFHESNRKWLGGEIRKFLFPPLNWMIYCLYKRHGKDFYLDG